MKDESESSIYSFLMENNFLKQKYLPYFLNMTTFLCQKVPQQLLVTCLLNWSIGDIVGCMGWLRGLFKVFNVVTVRQAEVVEDCSTDDEFCSQNHIMNSKDRLKGQKTIF
jgi:hypothetical protein